MLLALQHHHLAIVFGYFQRIEDVGEVAFAREAHVHHGADNLGDFARIRHLVLFY
jgi:hypothetical protein